MTASRSAVFPFVLLAALTCFPCATVAGSVDGPLSDYTVTTWNENDGLPRRPHPRNHTGSGRISLARHDAGLVRFDGVRFDTLSALGETRFLLER